MASVFKKPGVRKSYWYACYTDDTGRRVHRTTKRTNKSEAMTLALAWERAAHAGREGTLTELKAREVIAEMVERVTGQPMQHQTCREWLTEWVELKRGTVRDVSILKYERTIKAFLSSLGQRAALPLSAIGVTDIKRFRDSLAKSTRSAGTLNMITRGILGAPFHRAKTHGIIQMNPCAMLDPLVRGDSTKREPFSMEQVGDLLRHADEVWRGLILCGYFTGMRLRDCAQLRWGDIDRSEWQLSIVPRKSRDRKAITIPLHPELVTWLKKQPAGIARGPLFPSLVDLPTSGTYGLSSQFAAIMAKAKVKGKLKTGTGRKTSSLSFHSLRHSFVSALANAGIAPELRKKLSGHADEKIHAGYTHHEIKVLREAVGKLPSLG